MSGSQQRALCVRYYGIESENCVHFHLQSAEVAIVEALS